MFVRNHGDVRDDQFAIPGGVQHIVIFVGFDDGHHHLFVVSVFLS